MSPPIPLAYPPTALRQVPAGRVVGNPVGSSGSRAKALTAAELRACAEAYSAAQVDVIAASLTSAINAKYTLPGSGIPSSDLTAVVQTSLGKADAAMPLAGGTFSGPITGTSNTINQQNGLNAQTYNLFETYTSGTSFGALCLKTTASGHQIGSALGSAGGSNRAVQIGHFNSAGAFTSRLSVATDGTVSTSATIASGNRVTAIGQIFAGTGGLYFQQGTRSGIDSPADGRLVLLNNAANGFDRLQFGGTTSSFPCLRRSATSLAVRLADDSGDAPFQCGSFTHSPPASVALATNGQFSIEITSNTAGNLVYRGSDGTTRRMALTFV